MPELRYALLGMADEHRYRRAWRRTQHLRKVGLRNPRRDAFLPGPHENITAKRCNCRKQAIALIESFELGSGGFLESHAPRLFGLIL